MLINPRLLQKGIKRFGEDLVIETLRRIRLAQVQSAEKGASTAEILRDSAFWRRLTDYDQGQPITVESENEFHPIARFLLQGAQDNLNQIDSLVREINGVSEPATVPHQTPRAGVTPGADEV